MSEAQPSSNFNEDADYLEEQRMAKLQMKVNQNVRQHVTTAEEMEAKKKELEAKAAERLASVSSPPVERREPTNDELTRKIIEDEKRRRALAANPELAKQQEAEEKAKKDAEEKAKAEAAARAAKAEAEKKQAAEAAKNAEREARRAAEEERRKRDEEERARLDAERRERLDKALAEAPVLRSDPKAEREPVGGREALGETAQAAEREAARFNAMGVSVNVHKEEESVFDLAKKAMEAARAREAAEKKEEHKTVEVKQRTAEEILGRSVVSVAPQQEVTEISAADNSELDAMRARLAARKAKADEEKAAREARLAEEQADLAAAEARRREEQAEATRALRELEERRQQEEQKLKQQVAEQREALEAAEREKLELRRQKEEEEENHKKTEAEAKERLAFERKTSYGIVSPGVRRKAAEKTAEEIAAMEPGQRAIYIMQMKEAAEKDGREWVPPTSPSTARQPDRPALEKKSSRREENPKAEKKEKSDGKKGNDLKKSTEVKKTSDTKKSSDPKKSSGDKKDGKSKTEAGKSPTGSRKAKTDKKK